MGGGRRTSRRLKNAAKKLLLQTCASFAWTRQTRVLDTANSTVCSNSPQNVYPLTNPTSTNPSRMAGAADSPETIDLSNKNLCAICLDPLNCSSESSPSQSVFTAQCSHAFHFTCISSNVHHGSITCPICRAHWTELPRNSDRHSSFQCNQADPILQILDESIATLRVHRRSFLRSARYNDDDPIDPDHTADLPRLHFSLSPVSLNHLSSHLCSSEISGNNSCHLCETSLPDHLYSSSSLSEQSQFPSELFAIREGKTFFCMPKSRSYLCVKLARQPATDLVLVASPNGRHLRLMKQSLALVVFSLRPVDRLAIVTYSSAAARIFPLRRMTAHGKRSALQVIDRLFCMLQADPVEGIKKGVKILKDRVHQNPHSCILHLSDCETGSFSHIMAEVPFTVHRFHFGYGFGTSSEFPMHEFEGFLARILGGAVKELQLRIGEDTRILRLGELRGGEERRIPVAMIYSEFVRVKYSYVDGTIGECFKTGEVVVSRGSKMERSDRHMGESLQGRYSSVEGWVYHDFYMARRWAKYLHGSRI